MSEYNPNKNLKNHEKPFLSDLVEFSSKFKISLHPPPFDKNNKDEYSFDIDKFRFNDKFQYFIEEINRIKVPYEYAKKKYGKKIYLVIKKQYISGISSRNIF
jgi:carbohydrate-selective porin OprB